MLKIGSFHDSRQQLGRRNKLHRQINKRENGSYYTAIDRLFVSICLHECCLGVITDGAASSNVGVFFTGTTAHED
jgi:hypothetical protein